MTNPPSGDQLCDLTVLLDHALTMVVDHLTPEQRANLWKMAETMALGEHIERQCSAEVQRVLLSERPRVNPDGGRVGEAANEPLGGETGAAVEEGSAEILRDPYRLAETLWLLRLRQNRRWNEGQDAARSSIPDHQRR
jgi:hypothetical protein